jgi:ABC-type Mn2+/Zn2+ transport system permease subunit
VPATKNVSKNLHSYAMVSGISGIASAITVILLSYYRGIPAAPLVVLSGTTIFLTAVFGINLLHEGCSNSSLIIVIAGMI